MGKLENLLNALIKMGWKPWGNDVDSIRVITKTILSMIYKSGNGGELQGIRKLVSLESGLWQICTERELMKSKTSEHKINRYIKELITREEGDVIDADVLCSDLDPEWRLMESALVPEEKLEEFLLNNIIVEGNSK